jgi:hypothetical protein
LCAKAVKSSPNRQKKAANVSNWADWVAAWLDGRPSVGLENIQAALAALAPSEKCESLALNDSTFLIEAPSPIGNVFIVTKSGGSTAVILSLSVGPPCLDPHALFVKAELPLNVGVRL